MAALAGVDEVVEGVDVVGLAVVGEVTFSGVVLWVGWKGCATLGILGVGVLEGLVWHVLVLVLNLVLVLEVWILRIHILHVWIMRVRSWSLHVRILHISVLRRLRVCAYGR